MHKFSVTDMMARVGKGGRVVIPVALRKRLGLAEGDMVVLRADEESVRIIAPRQALTRIRRALQSRVPEGISLADELIADRRREAHSGD